MRGLGMQFVRNFGQGKRRFSLARVMAKLDNTSQTTIAIAFLVMNFYTWLRRVFWVFLCRAGKTTLVFGLMIIKNYKCGN
jgi:IS5 family transposase